MSRSLEGVLARAIICLLTGLLSAWFFIPDRAAASPLHIVVEPIMGSEWIEMDCAIAGRRGYSFNAQLVAKFKNMFGCSKKYVAIADQSPKKLASGSCRGGMYMGHADGKRWRFNFLTAPENERLSDGFVWITENEFVVLRDITNAEQPRCCSNWCYTRTFQNNGNAQIGWLARIIKKESPIYFLNINMATLNAAAIRNLSAAHPRQNDSKPSDNGGGDCRKPLRITENIEELRGIFDNDRMKRGAFVFIAVLTAIIVGIYQAGRV